VDTGSWLDLLVGPGGLLVALLVVIVTGMRRRWVFGWQYDAALKDCEEWKSRALRAMGVAERATDTTVAVVKQQVLPPLRAASDDELLRQARDRGLIE
jgi:hypothetical protein